MTEHDRGRDVDAEFEAIVARWDETPTASDDTVGEWARVDESSNRDESSDRDDASGSDKSTSMEVGRGRTGHDPDPIPATPDADGSPATPDADGAPGPPIVWRGSTDSAESDEEHFEPLPPEPLPPATDWHFWAILAGLGGGPVLLLFVVLFFREDSGWWILLGIGATVAGFVLLVLRQAAGTHEDDDGIRL